jgi:ABC-type molybdate transport system substrate-binding protein
LQYIVPQNAVLKPQQNKKMNSIAIISYKNQLKKLNCRKPKQCKEFLLNSLIILIKNTSPTKIEPYYLIKEKNQAKHGNKITNK